MGTLLVVLGLIVAIEGLVLALAPSLIEDALEALRAMPMEARRTAGLLALVLGAGLVLLAALVG